MVASPLDAFFLLNCRCIIRFVYLTCDLFYQAETVEKACPKTYKSLLYDRYKWLHGNIEVGVD